MGREVRRVPKGWKHPLGAHGYDEPLLDGSYKEDKAIWEKKKSAWDAGERDKYSKDYNGTFEGWNGGMPDPDTYRPDWPEREMVCYQVYETVSEGTPVSPVFETKEALVDWLVNDGSGMGIGGVALKMSREGASRFADSGWAPTCIGSPAGITNGLATHERSTERNGTP